MVHNLVWVTELKTDDAKCEVTELAHMNRVCIECRMLKGMDIKDFVKIVILRYDH